MSTNEMLAKVKELKNLKAMAEELSAEIASIEDAIKAEMLSQGVDEIKIDVFKVRYKNVKSSRFDTKSFKAEMPELAERYAVSTEYKRFEIC